MNILLTSKDNFHALHNEIVTLENSLNQEVVYTF